MNANTSVTDWATLFRLGNNLTGVFGVFLGSIIALGDVPQGLLAHITILHASSVLFFMCSWNALNDIYDFEIKLNKIGFDLSEFEEKLSIEALWNRLS